MELRHLRHFVALAEEGSFTRAATRELIVQSGLSTSVRALEKELGALLFVRGSRPVRLTAEGQALLPAARRTLEAAAAASQTVQDVRGLLSGHLRIGTYPVSPRLLPLPSWLAGFARAHPALEITVRQTDGPAMTQMVADGRLDCAVVDPIAGPPDGLHALPLASEPLMAALPAGHPLTEETSLTLHQLVQEPFVETDLAWTTRTRTDAAFAAAGLTRRIACEVADWRLVLDLVCAGLGIALVPPSHADTIDEETRNLLRLIPLSGVDIKRELGLVLPASQSASPAAKRFTSYLSQRIHESDAGA
ncbi:LysR family transcriptional regulator [Actinacidiphila glaucinigra]|uniref:LysR family transcriptional regulator n=1 Tax=Actinacidiphila glaucinigra TaxID=235986 RepID=UPI002DD9BEC9|nr:LysR family transcriptional regulator [Actinacidiphila glaucinigra]WSD57721.1 LysR family transcriptional regulator [Actinacidiphila glaucinigra]